MSGAPNEFVSTPIRFASVTSSRSPLPHLGGSNAALRVLVASVLDRLETRADAGEPDSEREHRGCSRPLPASPSCHSVMSETA